MARSGVKLSILSSYDKSGTDQAEKALDKFAKKYGQVDKATKSITLDETTAALARQSIAADQLAAKWDSTGKKMQDVGSTMTTAVTLPLGAVGAAAFTVASNFETSMSRVAGALNDPSANMQELRDLALKMGQDTIFSASEAGAAMEELAKGGLTAADIQGGALSTTMNLAAAGNLQLAEAANVVVQAMGAFNLGAADTEQAANALAGAAAASSADVSDLTQGLSQCSAQANSAGWTIQDTTAVLGAFADAGIRGSDAGTSLKTMLQRLSAPTDTAAKQMESLGINVRDSQGNMRDAASIAGELQEKLGGLDSATRDAAIQTIFGSDASRAALVLMNQGTEGIKRYTAATNDQTAAQRLADSQMGDSARKIEEMKGAIETAAIQVGDAIAPMVTDVAGAIGSVAESFSSLDEGQQKIVVGAMAVAAAAGPVTSGLGHMASAGGKLLSIYADITASMAKSSAAAAANATATAKVGESLSDAGSKSKGFITATNAAKAGAIGLGVALAALVAVQIADYVRSQEEMKEATDGLRNAQIDSIQSSKAVGTELGNLEIAYAGASNEANNAADSAINALTGYEQTAQGIASTSAAIDQLRSSQASLASSIQESFSTMYSSNAQLDVYRNTINELANQSGLTAYQQAQLQTAINGINEACGSSYSVIDAANGVIADQAGAAMSTTDAINALIDAKQREAQANALNSAYTDALKAQQDAATKLAEALEKQKQAQDALDEAMAVSPDSVMTYKYALDEANKAVSDAQGLYDSAAAASNGYLGQMNLITMAQQQGAGSNAAWLASQQQIGAIMTSNGQDVSYFAQQLDNAGISASTFIGSLQQSGISLEDIAMSYDGTLTSIANLCQQKGVAIPESLRNAIASGKPGVVSEATSMARDCVNGAQSASNASAAGSNLAGTMASAISSSSGSASGNARSMANNAVNAAHVSGESSGSYLAQGFAQGISSWAGRAIDAAANLARSVVDKIRQIGGEGSPWKTTIKSGRWAAQGLAVGLDKETSAAVASAEDMASQVVKASSVSISPSLSSVGMAMDEEVKSSSALDNSGVVSILNAQHMTLNSILTEIRALRMSLGSIITSAVNSGGFSSERALAAEIQRLGRLNV